MGLDMASKDNNTLEKELADDYSEFPQETWVTDESWVDDINVRWRKVIDDLLKGSKIVDAYARAYDIDTSLPKDYNVAASAGSRLLRNVNFQNLWDKVNRERGFNDQAADSRLLDLMVNPGIEPKDRFKAIKHYNELRGRIITKTDLTSDGKPIVTPAIMPVIEPRIDAPAQTEATNGS